jgi:hypothetical protein
LWFIVVLLNNTEEVSAYQVFLSLAIAIDAGRVLAGSIHDEIRGQTLASLVMLPRSTVGVVYSKFAGAMLGWLPAAFVDLLVSISTSEGLRNFEWILQHPMGFCVASFFILIPHVSAVLSLYMRWGATPLGTALCIGLFFSMEVVALPVNTDYWGRIIGLFVIGICVCCHIAIALRVSALAGK